MSDEKLMIDKDLCVPIARPGQKVFHYTSAEGLKGIVDGKFWITERHFLNDSAEFSVATDSLCQILRENINNNRLVDRLITDIQMEEGKMTADVGLENKGCFYGTYVISFSLTDDNILLWSEYSNFMGYSMQFDLYKLLDAFTPADVFFHGEVVYDEEQKKDCFLQSIKVGFFENEYWNNLNSWSDFERLTERELKEFVQQIYVYCIAYNMFFKKECYADEKEYRVVFDVIHDGGISNKEKEELFFRVKNEVMMPFIKRGINCGKCLEAVTIGPKNYSDIAKKGLEYFFRDKKMNVPVRVSKIPLRY